MNSRTSGEHSTAKSPHRSAVALGIAAATFFGLFASLASAGVGITRRGCPLRFDEQTIGLARTCLFVGRFNTPDSGPLMAAFAGDGATFVVALARGDATPLLYLPAEVRTPTAGTLLRWRDGIQPAAEADGAALSDVAVGSVTLEDGGRRLRLRAAPQPGQEGSPAEFIGNFVDMVEAGGDTVVSQR